MIMGGCTLWEYDLILLVACLINNMIVDYDVLSSNQTPDSSSLSESGDWDSYSLARLYTTGY